MRQQGTVSKAGICGLPFVMAGSIPQCSCPGGTSWRFDLGRGYEKAQVPAVIKLGHVRV